MRIVAIVLLIACAHAKPPCVSKCGMLLEDVGNGSMSCDVLNKAEDEMLRGIDNRFCKLDGRMCYERMCSSIFGWQLRLDENVITYIKYDDRPALPAVGLSNCETKEMWLGANQDWRHGSYPHEIFHVGQGCVSGFQKDGNEYGHGPGHDGWTDAGIYDFIDEVRR